MKKLSVIALLLVGVITANAQHQIYPFFDDKGAVRIETTELSADTLVNVFHRADDIVWSRVVYRVIDMRYKQNYQLYFPDRSDDAEYRSLFKVIVDAIVKDNLPVYRVIDNIKPVFTEDRLYSKVEIPERVWVDDPNNPAVKEKHKNDPDARDVAKSMDMLINYDSVSDAMTFRSFAYDGFVKNQLKYLVQEIVFFDKHTSRLYSKLIAIAPLHADYIREHKEDGKIQDALRESILFWIPFDALRPHLAHQYVIPQANDTKRITFDEFFAKKLYTSYLVGESNTYDRMFLDYAQTEDEIKKEQQRVFDELLNFEQDLWEY